MKWILVLFVLLTALITGCGGGGGNDEGSWNMPHQSPTYIVPTAGTYQFATPVANTAMTVTELEVIAVGEKRIVRLPHQYYMYEAEVVNGTFLIKVGDIAPGTGSYPYEGYAIAGRFTSEEVAVGRIKLAVYGHISNNTDFTATLTP